MTKRKTSNNSKEVLSIESLRHAEYYDMQGTFDKLYAKSKNGETFDDLMSIILSKENILLAYRNIKANTGSVTPGTDKLSIKDIGRLTADEVVNNVRQIICGSRWGYRPKPVRRTEIPKPNGTTRPIGIPCIWDRLIQQCIKQVMEPICEAKFCDNSYGFRPLRSAEQAIAETYRLLQQCHLHYVIEVDIKSFFDNVDHSKLIKQIWAMGFHDKHLIYVLKQTLKAPIKELSGAIVRPTKGTPQGGILSPLLGNIVLNELDHWIESQWEENPLCYKWKNSVNANGSTCKSNGYKLMRKTNLKEMYFVRYADDVRIFCRTKTDAENTKFAVTQWLRKRLRLDVSPEKTRIVNVKRTYADFLGFKIKLHKKSGKHVVKSHMSDNTLKREKEKLIKQAHNVARPKNGRTEYDEINRYNSMVMGIQNYYQIATDVSADLASMHRAVMTTFTARLQKGGRLKRHGRKLSQVEQIKYGRSKKLRYISGSDQPIYPIGYVQTKPPLCRKRNVCQYTAEGRRGLHDNLRINTSLMLDIMRLPVYGKSIEYADNRISLFSAQMGKCAVTGRYFMSTEDIHCHHKIPSSVGGSDKYDNLVLVLEPVHKLIHANNPDVISKYLTMLNLTQEQLTKVNSLRQIAGLPMIA